jgi:hypothetical protein
MSYRQRLDRPAGKHSSPSATLILVVFFMMFVACVFFVGR